MANPIDKEGLELARTINAKLVAIRADIAALEAAVAEGGGGGGGGSSAWGDLTGVPAPVTALTGTNTGDETTATIKTKLSITTLSGSNTGDQTLPTLASLGAAPLASPTFTGTVTIPSGASISGYLTTATAASTYATFAGPNNFTGSNDFSGTVFFDTGTAFNYTPGVEAVHRSALGLVIGTNVLAPNGSGASLTALNGAQITSGNIPVARIATALTTPGPIGGTTASTIAGTTGTFSGTLNVTGNSTFAAITETTVAIGTVVSTHTLAITSGTTLTATLTASTACTFTMPSTAAGKSFLLLLKQAASTGNGTATFTSVKWAGGVAPVITATAGRMDILAFTSDGTNWYGAITQNYTP